MEEELHQINAVVTDARILAQELWHEERRIMDAAKAAASRARSATHLLLEDILPTIAWPDDDQRLPNAPLLQETRQALEAAQDTLDNLEASAKAQLAEALAVVDDKIQEWDGRFERSEKDYQRRLDELGQAGSRIQALADRRQTLQDRKANLDEDERRLKQELMPNHERLLGARSQGLNILQDNRKGLTRKRREKVESLNSVLDHSVRLKVHERGERSEFRRRLSAIAEGSYVQSADLDRLAEEGHPIPIVSAFLSGNLRSISDATQVEIDKIEKIASVIRDRNRESELYSLQLVEVEDIVDVQLKVEGGEYRSLEELSHGQKCMVVLMVALAEGRTPLVVDQPEDALHAPGIEQGIVGTLRRERGGRQCIFATLNGNILVSADAEQIIALDANAVNGWIASTGCLDRFDHRELVVYHVEGGDEAFERRQAMYTLEVVV